MNHAESAVPIPGRVLAVDHGLKRIGIAISDPLRLFARPLVTLEVAALDDPAASVVELAVEWGASDIVIGVPLMPSGDVGEQAAIVLEFAESLRSAIQQVASEIKLWTIDESDSTVTAEALRPSGAASGRQRQSHASCAGREGRGARTKRAMRGASDAGLDAVAAAVILESWLRER